MDGNSRKTNETVFSQQMLLVPFSIEDHSSTLLDVPFEWFGRVVPKIGHNRNIPI
jgi:hypothetical protein